MHPKDGYTSTIKYIRDVINIYSRHVYRFCTVVSWWRLAVKYITQMVLNPLYWRTGMSWPLLERIQFLLIRLSNDTVGDKKWDNYVNFENWTWVWLFRLSKLPDRSNEYKLINQKSCKIATKVSAISQGWECRTVVTYQENAETPVFETCGNAYTQTVRSETKIESRDS